MCETVGLWFMSRQFGMSLTATEILVWPNRRSTGIDAFTLGSDTKLQPHRNALPVMMNSPNAENADPMDEA